MSTPMALKFSFVLVLAGVANAQHWFTAARWFDPSLGEMRAAADLDGDGDVDIVRFAGNTATALLHGGAGEFTAGPTTALPLGWTRPELLIDLDHDGDRDLVLGASPSYVQGRGLLVLHGNGAGSFGAPAFVPLAGNPATLAEGEINGDGVPDLAIQYTVPQSSLPCVAWLLGSAFGNYQLQPVLALLPSGQTYVSGIAVFDANGDGVDDVAAVGDSLLRILITVGTTPTLGPSFPYVTDSTGGVLAADVDGDLHDDLIVYGHQNLDLHLVVMKTRPGTTFAISSQVFPQYGQGTFLAGDLDGDGDPDLFWRSLSILSSFYGAIENVNAGVFAPRWQQAPSGLPFNALSGNLSDFDGDGKLDCVDVNSVFFGSGSWADPSGSARELDAGSFDMDGDGDLDVPQLVGVVQRNDGRGRFTAVANTWPATGPGFVLGQQGVVAGDFDGDGRGELLVPNHMTTSQFPVFLDMHRVQDDGNGAFVDLGAATAVGDRIEVGALRIDSNHDGVLDLVDSHGLWVNNGTQHWSLLAGAFANFVPCAVADLDGDGDDDCLGLQSGNLVVMRQNGPHTFATVVIAVNPGFRPTLGDLDDDGDLDIAVGTYPTVGVQPYLNQGGNFVAGPLITAAFATGASMSGVAVGDIDADGQNDVVGIDLSLVTVLRRSGPGLTYDAPRYFAVAGARRLADIDQDGDLDLIGDYGARNVHHEGPTAGYQRQYGTAAVGFGGRRPTCSTIGIVRPNQTPVLRLASALGGSLALLGLGTSETAQTSPQLPGLVFYTQPTLQLAVSLTGPAGVAGAGSCNLPLALSPALAGLTFYLQGYVLDPSAPSWFTHSNGLELHVGN